MTPDKKTEITPGPAIDKSAVLAFGARRSPSNTQELVDEVIAFANGDIHPRVEDYRRLAGIGQVPEDVVEGPDPVFYTHDAHGKFQEVTPQQASDLAKKKIEERRQFAIEMLEAAASGTRALTKWLKTARLSGLISGVSLRPVLSKSRNRIRLKYSLQGPSDARGWILFSAAILSDEASDKNTDIGRCRLEGCGRFFRVVRLGRGKPARYFCPGTDHQKLQNALENTERKARSRARAQSRGRQ